MATTLSQVEKSRIRWQRWYAKNSDRFKRYVKRWQKKNPRKVRRYVKKYRSSAKYRTTSKAWWKKNEKRCMENRKLWASIGYRSWQHMKDRCLNKKCANYYLYGARGVKVCKRWLKSFKYFLADMGPRPSSIHSIDRWPDPFGDYKPSNCRWATPLQQRHNRRDNVPKTPHRSA